MKTILLLFATSLVSAINFSESLIETDSDRMKWQARGQCRNGKCNNPVKKPCVNDQLKDYITEDGKFDTEVYFLTMLEIITYTDQAKAIAQFSEVYERAFEWRF